MKQPFFSVIIPTLNEEKYLPIILKSLSKQTYRDFELIMVDGGSKDRTVEVFENFRGLMPSVNLQTASRANVGYQRNLGGKKATGKYLVFLDADCDVDRTFLEELHVSILKKKITMATTWIRPDSNNKLAKLLILMGNMLNELMNELNNPYTGGYNTIIKRDAFLALAGFREDLKIDEDHDLAIRAQKKGIQCFLLKEPQVTFSLRRHRSKGTLSVLWTALQGEIYYLTRQYDNKSHCFDYPMGGHVHTIKKKKKINLAQIDTYLRGIKRLEKEIDRLLEE